jgi:CheY-like chemotaxis protein
MDSRSLFAKQVRSQCETLCELLACSAGHPVPETVLERCKVSIRMLAGTMLVLGLSDWERLLRALESLLTVHGERRIAWDERVAQLIFEMIEKEELLASCHEREGEAGGRNAVPEQEVEALIAEVDALRQESELAPSIPQAASTPGSGERFSRVASEFSGACERVLAAVSSEAWQSRSADTAFVEDLRRGLGTIEFYAQAMDRIVASVEETMVTPKCDLTPLETALGDFAVELTRGTGRALSVQLRAGDIEIEPGLLPAAYWILHAMVADVFERCDEPSIEVDIDVYDRYGALYWRVRDNGETFFSDSRLDHEDQLAFYPGLRHVVRTLREHRGTLAVEPNGGADGRFEFTLPASTQAEALVIWDQGGKAFATRAVQVVEVISSQTELRREDAYGEYVTIESRRIPLLNLDALFPDAPGGRSHLAVVGLLEKRVAFYVPGEGVCKAGVILGDTMPSWKGIPHDVARVDGRRVPLMDAGDVLRGYLSITGAISPDAPPEVAEAAMESFLMTPPPDVSTLAESRPADAIPTEREDTVEVLVVEQSESTRNALTEILARQRIRASFAGDVEEAIHLIGTRRPRVIISEFRIPTMAAKKIVDRLRQEGRDIPVLVTTSQSGKTADLLVEKLGASGYLSKPLSATQVASQLSGFLGAVR